MKKEFNIAIIGLGQIGIFLYNELKRNQKTIQLLTGKKLKLLVYQQETKIKKEDTQLIKRSFLKIQLKCLRVNKLIFCLNALDYQMECQRDVLSLL